MNDNYVIIQNRIENGPEGTPIIKEVLLAYPDTKQNASKRLLKWQTMLEVPNIRLRRATKQDYRKATKKQKKEKK